MKFSARCFKAAAQAAKLRRINQTLSENGIRVTGKTGLKSVNQPRPILHNIYSDLLTNLSALPQDSVYRQATEAFVNQKISIMKANEDAPIETLEEKLDGELLIEEIIAEAQDELSLVKRMIENKP